MMAFLVNLRNIDRRIMYLLLIVLVAVALKWDFMRQKMPVDTAVRGVYNAVEDVPKGKIAVISITWGAGTIGENRPQTEVIARHLFRKRVPFVMISWDQQGTTLAYNTVKRVADEMHMVYGRDWINAGYRPGYVAQFLQAFVNDVPGKISRDFRGVPVVRYPMMKGIKTAEDIGLAAEITPSGTLETWIAFLGQPHHVPLVYCPTAVMVPEGYNYLDAGQIKGMLPGLIGAAKYEQVLSVRGFASRAANALSVSHLLIILLIILGNLGYLAARRLERQ